MTRADSGEGAALTAGIAQFSGIRRGCQGTVMAIVRLPDVQARIKDLGLIADASSGAAFRERIARDIPKYTAAAKAAGIKFD